MVFTFSTHIGLVGPPYNIGHNIRKIITYLFKDHFTVTIGDALIN